KGGPGETCARGGDDCGAPDEKREEADHCGLDYGGEAREDREEYAETAGDLSGSGEVGPEGTIRQPGWHEFRGLLHVNDVREPDGDERDGEEDPCNADRFIAGQECKW